MNSMAIFLLIISLAGLLYAILILSFSYGWDHLKPFKIQSEKLPSISIVVAVRNEGRNIPSLLESLLRQEYPHDLCEIILVDDHSEDETVKRINELDQENRVDLINMTGDDSGKKKALQLGIQKATGALIATTDADCVPGNRWLKTLASAYQSGKYRMISGPVAVNKPKGFLGMFQALELLSLVASGAGAIAIGKPVMCNGANLAFDREAFFLVEAYQGNEHIPGGDDLFLMEKIKKKYSSQAITFLKDKEAIVLTKGTTGIKDFFNQRIRWVAKSPAYRDSFLILTALTVLAFNLFILFAFIAAFFDKVFLIAGLTLFVLKSLVDIVLLWKICSFAGQQFLTRYFIFFQIIYIPFTAVMGIIGNIIGYKWKGR